MLLEGALTETEGDGPEDAGEYDEEDADDDEEERRLAESLPKTEIVMMKTFWRMDRKTVLTKRWGRVWM